MHPSTTPMSLTLKRQRPIPAWEQIYSPSWCRIGLSRRFYATGVGKAHRASQAGERLGAGEHWTDSGLVFTTEFGRPVEPRNILRTAELAAKKAGVEGVGVHTLRHSAATAWLDAGVHVKAVGRPARALLDLHHRGHLRPRIGRDDEGCNRRPVGQARSPANNFRYVWDWGVYLGHGIPS